MTGDFALSGATSGGPACGGTLAYGASCYIEVTFAPSSTGPQTGTLTVQGGGATALSALSGYGATDPGIALSPAALVFTNVPDSPAAQQSVAVTNTGASTVQVGQPVVQMTTAGTSFAAASTCASLATGASCSVALSFTAMRRLPRRLRSRSPRRRAARPR